MAGPYRGGTPHRTRVCPAAATDCDQLLTNVTVYWLTATAGSSARLYYEAARSGDWGPPATSTVPIGIAAFPREIAPRIRRFAEQSDPAGTAGSRPEPPG